MGAVPNQDQCMGTGVAGLGWTAMERSVGDRELRVDMRDLSFPGARMGGPVLEPVGNPDVFLDLGQGVSDGDPIGNLVPELHHQVPKPSHHVRTGPGTESGHHLPGAKFMKAIQNADPGRGVFPLRVETDPVHHQRPAEKDLLPLEIQGPGPLVPNLVQGQELDGPGGISHEPRPGQRRHQGWVQIRHSGQ